MVARSTAQGDASQLVPDYDRLFALIRAAGPSNSAKARAVDQALKDVRIFCQSHAIKVDDG
jgi:hypothetical protein